MTFCNDSIKSGKVIFIYLNCSSTHCFICLLLFSAGGEVTKPRFTQYFRGSLSGLTIRPGKIESQKVISCLQACKEGLDINSLESLDKSIKVHVHRDKGGVSKRGTAVKPLILV